MWDVQTGGLIHTFTTQPEVNDIAISTSGDHIAWGSSNGSIGFWNIHTKMEGKGFRISHQPVVTIYWLSPQKLAVANQDSLRVHSVTTCEILDSLPLPGHVRGMVHLDEDRFLVGTKPGLGVDQELCVSETISNQRPGPLERRRPGVDHGRLMRRKMC